MRSVLVLALILTAAAGCSRSTETQSGDAPSAASGTILVTSQPLQEMAQSVAKDSLKIQSVVPEQTISRLWKPAKKDAQVMQQADAILINGAGYEPWMDRVSLPGSRVKDTAAGYYSQFIRIPDAVTHQHGPEGKHGHPGTVWATWLDPDLAISQLAQVTAALTRLAPAHQQQFETESAKFRTKLESLNAAIVEIKLAVDAADVTVLADGPFYQYLTERLGWKLHYLHWDESMSPSEQDRNELQERMKTVPAEGLRLFLLSTRQPDQAAETAANAGLTVVRMDLCEYPDPAGAPLTQRLEGNLTRLKAAVTGNK
jgi:zinc transport system substrate-binding protein